VTHPRKSSGMAKAGPPSMDDMAGGTAYQRAAQCVLWLQSLKDPPGIVARAGSEQHTVVANKMLAVLKARNSPGMGTRIAYSFGGARLQFDEHGVIDNEP
jgi:hypothetical protein